jgi:hypothetical protein
MSTEWPGTNNTSRKDLIGGMANIVETGGSGRSDADVARGAVEAERELFPLEQKVDFMSLREADLRSIWEDYPLGTDVKREGSVESPSGLRIEWTENGSPMVSIVSGETVSSDRLEIANTVEMKELIDLYRTAEELLMQGLRKASGEPEPGGESGSL